MMKKEIDYVPISIPCPDPYTTCQHETKYVRIERYYYKYDDDDNKGVKGGGEIVLLLGGVAYIIYLFLQGDFFNPKSATTETWQTFENAVSFLYRYSFYVFLISLKFVIWDMNVTVWKSIMHVAASAHDLIMNRSRGSVLAFDVIGAIAFCSYFFGSMLGIFYVVAYAVEKYTKVCVCVVAMILFGFLILPGLAGLCGWLGLLVYRSL